MTGLFIKLLNMGAAAAWLILAVCAARLLLRRQPKWMRCAMWALVGVRLLCPFTVKSALSLVPGAATVPRDIMTAPVPEIHSGVEAINSAVNPVLSGSFAPDPVQSANPLQILLPVLSAVWLAGCCAMAAYALVSYLRIKRHTRGAVMQEKGVYVCRAVPTPFILGVFAPRIYLPLGLNGETREHVLAHERAHLARRDHLWKAIGFALLAVYWFNPLVWLAYILLCRDIELACDERVVKSMPMEVRRAYSESLLECSLRRRMIAACPLAFGETGVKSRIKSVLNYRRPAFWIIAVSIIACAVLAMCFLTDPRETAREPLREDYTLEEVKSSGCFVMENGAVTSGNREWESFLKKTAAGRPASLRIAKYYTLGDPSGYSAEYYREHAPEYPMLFVFDIDYDGAGYTVRWLEDGAEHEKGYLYLKRFEGEPTSASASYTHYLRYVLLNDDTATWEEIESSYIMSVTSEAVEHFTVYEDLDYIRDDSWRTAANAQRIFRAMLGKAGCTVTDAVAAPDAAYDLVGVVLFTGEDGNECNLAFVHDGLVNPVCIDADGNNVPAPELGRLTYLGGGAVSLAIRDTRDGSVQMYTMEYSRKDANVLYTAGTELLDTDSVVSELLDEICSSPFIASATGAYIAAHEGEWKSLLSMGDTSLAYIYRQFLSGGQDGLRGSVMHFALVELMEGEAPAMYEGSAQPWFDNMLAAARERLAALGADGLRLEWPKLWLLMNLSGDIK